MDDDPGLLFGIDDDGLRIRRAVAEEIDDIGFVAIANISRDGAGEAGGEDERVGTDGGGSVAVAGERVVAGVEIAGDADVVSAGGGEGVGEEGFGRGSFAGGGGVVVGC